MSDDKTAPIDDELSRMSKEELLARTKALVKSLRESGAADAELETIVAALEANVEQKKKAKQVLYEADHDLAIAEDHLRDEFKRVFKKADERRAYVRDAAKVGHVLSNVSPAMAVTVMNALLRKPPGK